MPLDELGEARHFQRNVEEPYRQILRVVLSEPPVNRRDPARAYDRRKDRREVHDDDFDAALDPHAADDPFIEHDAASGAELRNDVTEREIVLERQLPARGDERIVLPGDA